MPATLIVLAGIPGSGKSGWASTLLSSAAVVSSDAIREELTGDESIQDLNDEVFSLFHSRIDNFLRIGGTVVADSTALTTGARATLRAIARLNDAVAHLVYFSNLEQACSRNLSRDRTVPADVMMRMLEKYERFRLNLPTEAQHWNSVTEVRSWAR